LIEIKRPPRITARAAKPTLGCGIVSKQRRERIQ
jgi:hypothetical protein